jgi:UDP-glucuronate decarboxylase
MLTKCIVEDVGKILCADLPWERFAGKRILVTGAAGFLPGYFVETLLALGKIGNGVKEVVGLVRDRKKAERRFRHHLGRKDFSLYQSDLSGPLSYDGKFDYVIHAASQASPRFYLTDPVGTTIPNALGTYYLLDRSRRDGCEGFLFLSSGEVYGRTEPGVAVKEDTYGVLNPMAVRSCYGESKRMGENFCVCMYHQYGIPTYVGRLAHTYGPGLAPDDGRVFSDFLADIVANRDIVVKSDGSACRSFCYVSDAITANFAILLKGQPARPYNVCNDEAFVSIRELAETLVAAFPERNINAVFDETRVSTSYAKSQNQGERCIVEDLRALGWVPTIGIAEGFRRTVASMEEVRAQTELEKSVRA